ncbi:MAG: 2-oxoglutarate dehydrogenase E1 component [Alphaproteobacteria bacterium]
MSSETKVRDNNGTHLKAVLDATAFLSGGSAAFIESLYRRYLDNPGSIGGEWREFFDALGERNLTPVQLGRGPAWRRDAKLPVEDGELVAALSGAPGAEAAEVSGENVRAAALDSIHLVRVIRTYRTLGHLEANLDPLALEPRKSIPQLQPSFYGFHNEDMDRPIALDGVLGLEQATPRQTLEILRRTYCGNIGYEYMHITDPEQRDWIQRRVEGETDFHFTPEGRRAILNKLIEAEQFEKFCAVKFIGTKRFGLDGGEAMVPALEQIIKRGGQLGVKDIVLGMAHRGRLNVLANVMAKPYRQIFHEFQGGSHLPSDVQGSGDVKYHLGASSDREFDGVRVHVSLTANPSHLEAVNPVVLGKARAKQQQNDDKITRTSVLPLLLHGDAAFAGQGVVAECFAMSGTRGFRTGGTIHFIINNQIGFTTAPAYARSSPYPSDVALMVQAPIFHVNGDDPEAVVYCARLAAEFRQLFHKDVVIDMFCYRRFGHNETDEPSFTQPLMYRAIKEHPTALSLYAERLVGEHVLSKGEVRAMQERFTNRLDEEFEAASRHRANKADWLDGRWTGFETAPEGDRRGTTGVERKILQKVGKALTSAPEGVRLHRTLARVMQAKAKIIEAGEGIDWAMAELLAFGTLLLEGYPVRLSGQDTVRGTFSQRHAAFIDQETEERYVPLNHIVEGQAEFEAIDSLLSEAAVLGFEYGYSLAEPKALVLWEAQFGDFANAAQVYIDQFIASGEMKWLRMSGLALLLPHGFEGQGPEHSSARLERFLQLCAEDNIQVVYPSTPANYFHVLRRQVHRAFRKPLVVMTPKSLLRHKECISNFADMGPGTSFHRVLWDRAQSEDTLVTDDKITRVVLCTGKVYYDLHEERRKRGEKRIQVLRLEQLYPFPGKSLEEELGRFPEAEVVWCQEEPQNQGAWTFVVPRVEAVLTGLGRDERVRYAGRPEGASPAAGHLSLHQAELAAFLNDALTI